LAATDVEVRCALEAVRRAGAVAARVQRDLAHSALLKEDLSPVTVADFAVQAVVGCLLRRAFPDAALVAEEDSGALRQEAHAAVLESVVQYVAAALPDAAPDAVCAWIDAGNDAPGQRFWTLDPIDGTKGFLRGEQYAIALALVEDGKVALGVLGCPNLVEVSKPVRGGPGSIVAATRGQGAWWAPMEGEETFRRLRVSDRHDPAQARLLRSAESGHTNVGRIGRLIERLGIEAEAVRMDSQAKYAVLAAGEGDVLARLLSAKQPDYEERIWDQAAGSLVVEEAGGRVTDLSGAALDFGAGKTLARNRGVLATNGLLHEAVLDALRAVG